MSSYKNKDKQLCSKKTHYCFTAVYTVDNQLLMKLAGSLSSVSSAAVCLSVVGTTG